MIRYKNLTILVHNVKVNLNGAQVSLRIIVGMSNRHLKKRNWRKPQ